jgi:hypothetical protein
MGYLGLPRATLGYLGLPWATLGYLGLSWATLGYLGLPWATLGYLGLPWATLGYLGLPWAIFKFSCNDYFSSKILCRQLGVLVFRSVNTHSCLYKNLLLKKSALYGADFFSSKFLYSQL